MPLHDSTDKAIQGATQIALGKDHAVFGIGLLQNQGTSAVQAGGDS